MKKNKFKILIVCFAIQLIIPLFLVWRHYDTLRNGEQYKIAVSVLDPYDPFRGRYVEISPVFEVSDGTKTRSIYEKYVKIEKDKNGYAIITPFETKKESNLVNNLVINKYYMSEEQAPEAEDIILENNDEGDLYIIICVKNGSYVTEGLYYKNQRIEEYLLSQSTN